MNSVGDLLARDAIRLGERAGSRDEAVRRCGEVLVEIGAVGPAYVEAMLEREQSISTYIGEGVAIPHGKVPGLPGLTASFGRAVQGIDFRAIDGRPTHLFFALFAPENSAGAHLKALARISRIFKNPAFRDAILKAAGAAEIYRLIEAEDAKY